MTIVKKAQAGVNTFQCPIVVGTDKRGRKILCHGTGFLAISLRKLAEIRVQCAKTEKLLLFHCGHYHRVGVW